MTARFPKPVGKHLRGRPPRAESEAADAPVQFDLPIETYLCRASPTDTPSQTVLKHLGPAKVSQVYESYWRFAAERQAIFVKQASGQGPPWTEDAILTTYKFTNAYRASDRVSQYLIRHVIYREDLPNTAREVFFRLCQVNRIHFEISVYCRPLLYAISVA